MMGMLSMVPESPAPTREGNPGGDRVRDKARDKAKAKVKDKARVKGRDKVKDRDCLGEAGSKRSWERMEHGVNWVLPPTITVMAAISWDISGSSAPRDHKELSPSMSRSSGMPSSQQRDKETSKRIKHRNPRQHRSLRTLQSW